MSSLLVCLVLLAPIALALPAPARIEAFATSDVVATDSAGGLLDEVEPLLPHLARVLRSDPLDAPDLGFDLARRLADPAAGVFDRLAAAHEARTGIGLERPAIPEPAPLEEEIARAWLARGVSLGEAEGQSTAASARLLDPFVERALAHLVAAATDAEALRGDPFARLADEDLWQLVQNAHMSRPWEGEAERIGLLHETAPTHLEATARALDGVDAEAVVRAQARLAVGVDEALALLASMPPASTSSATEVFRADTPYGPILVTGITNDVHTDDVFVHIDLGGNDHYVNRAAGIDADLLAIVVTPVPPSPTDPAFPAWAQAVRERIHRATNASITIDLSGDDHYEGDVGVQGYGGFGGFGVLVDLEGNDHYEAARFAQGAGQVVGFGLLVDRAGDDVYSVTAQGQGFGQDLGVGGLVDADGRDTYTAEIGAQGVGILLGVGILVDLRGDDAYACHGIANFQPLVIPITIPRPGSLCQAVGFGGVGILIEGEGDDGYHTASSFHVMTLVGAAVLVDLGGNDVHDVGEWTNGVGVLGAALLLDATGDDRYTSKQTVGPWVDTYVGSNGEGYVGVGILVDGEGDDVYVSIVDKGMWLPQYACGAGCSYRLGVGVLIDGAGNDIYESEVGQGGAVAGVSLLLEVGGNDVYTLSSGSTRGQGYVENAPFNFEGLSLKNCWIGYLVDLGGDDVYDNPVTTYGTRGNDRHWGQGDLGRGIDGLTALLDYALAGQLLADLNLLLDVNECKNGVAMIQAIVCEAIERVHTC